MDPPYGERTEDNTVPGLFRGTRFDK